ncbi:ribonuclease P protein component [Devosia subaequoris]|uniref:Ribonuclease P protein component n=1 Tax=Devosia subaequoris TaxID=395930 RepID=A0A7W6ING4_9HYPH|nr:ribonuclease P protein component [Devosia subaequoris]MBB4052862.1 ribonuclease P protein component [Devosia subaequoris]MCP1210013.1 ribonuclease P protein component [Devosia subaequoris]
MTAEQSTRQATLRRLKRRAQFLNAARGNRAGRSAFGLQAVPSTEADPGIGFTVTKKVGNSPERNRMKRRLRAAAAACASDFVPGHDYVLLARREALSQPFVKLVADLGGLIARVHDTKPGENRKSSGRGQRNPRP